MIAKTGAVIIILGAVEIVVVLFWTRHLDNQPNRDLSLLDFCAAEIRRIDRQIRLLRSVNWWYSGPLMFGACVMFYGMISSVIGLPAFVHYGFLASSYAGFLAIMFIVYRVNARAVETGLVPLRDDLAELMHRLECGDSDGMNA